MLDYWLEDLRRMNKRQVCITSLTVLILIYYKNNSFHFDVSYKSYVKSKSLQNCMEET